MNLRSNGHARSWLLFLIGISAGALLYAFAPAVRKQELVLAWVAGCWAITHFQHQHTLESNKFFFELFNRFNQRYDEMNNALQLIADGEGPLTSEDRARVVDYFNLCAEEYMFYRRGYIPEDVYRAWRAGMDYYAKSERFGSVWEEESGTQSYYGYEFTPAVRR
jgi:hypothetical protein